MAIYTLYVNDALPFLEFLTTPIKGASVTESLFFTEIVKVSPIRISVTDHLFLGSQPSITTSIKNITVTDSLNFEERTGRGSLIVITDFFGLFDEVLKTPFEVLSDNLSFTESVTVHNAKNATDLITFTDTATFRVIRTISIVDTLDLQDNLAFYMLGCGFSAIELPTLTDPGQIVLTFGTLVLTLRNPEFGDSRNLEIARINRKTRGGDLVVFRDPMWPKTEVLRFAFDYLTETKAYALDHFLKVSLGQEITLVDYEGRSWTGIIRAPQGSIKQQGRCQYQADFEFEGILV